MADSHRPSGAVSIPHRVPLLCYFGRLCSSPHWQPVAATELLVLCAFLIGCPPLCGRRVSAKAPLLDYEKRANREFPFCLQMVRRNEYSMGDQTQCFFQHKAVGIDIGRHRSAHMLSTRWGSARKGHVLHSIGQCEHRLDVQFRTLQQSAPSYSTLFATRTAAVRTIGAAHSTCPRTATWLTTDATVGTAMVTSCHFRSCVYPA